MKLHAESLVLHAESSCILHTQKKNKWHQNGTILSSVKWYIFVEKGTAKKHGQWSSKIKKGTCPVLVLATWHHTTESV